MLKNLQDELRKLANPEKAKIFQGFFKTGKGEYGEGDVFLGISVPESRKVAIRYKDLSWEDMQNLLASKIHEERLIALLILVHNFEKGSATVKQEIYDYYLSHTKYINNWDLVDLSADKIVGEWLVDKSKSVLLHLAESSYLWERRIAVIATFAYIKRGSCQETFTIAEKLLGDKHDLIQKAVGWMLREAGKRASLDEEKAFLNKHYKHMGRTALRYAIERFPENLRKAYLSGTV